MLTKDTMFVEITGVFGAGYVPKLIEDVQHRLREGFRLRTSSGARKMNVLGCIDNSIAEKNDVCYRDKINELILKAQLKVDSLSNEERENLVGGLRWVDDRVIDFVSGVYKKVDLVIRRGGILQTYALLADESWRRINADRRPQPKIPIFVVASEQLTQATFSEPGFMEHHRLNAPSYCRNAARALELQQAWWESVRDLPGVIKIDRPDRHTEFVDALAKVIKEASLAQGTELIPWRRVFISYGHSDLQLALKLKRSLEQYQVDCWLANEDLRTGEEFRSSFAREISERDAFIVIASESSLGREWVRFETNTAVRSEHDSGRPVILPIRSDGAVLAANDSLAVQLRQRQVADFSKWQEPDQFAKSIDTFVRDLLNLERVRILDSRLTAH